MCTVTHATTMKSSAPLVYGTLVRSFWGFYKDQRGHTAGGAAGKRCPLIPFIQRPRTGAVTAC